MSTMTQTAPETFATLASAFGTFGAALEPLLPLGDGRRQSLRLASEAGVDMATLTRIAAALRVERKATIVIPMQRYEMLSRGKGWARKGRGDKAVWGERVEGGEGLLLATELTEQLASVGRGEQHALGVADGPAELELLVDDELRKSLQAVEIALREARLGPSQLHAVLLSGGGAEMPLFARLIEEMVLVRPREGVPPEEAIARGAALVGASRLGDGSGSLPAQR